MFCSTNQSAIQPNSFSPSTKPRKRKEHPGRPPFITFLHQHSVSNHSKMKPTASVSFKCKSFFNPCKRVLQAFKFKLKKPLFIRTLPFRRHKVIATKTSKRKWFPPLRSIFHSRRSRREMDRVMQLTSCSDVRYQQAPFPSPLTPAYVKMGGIAKVVSGQEEVEDACRSFEKYLVEMVVEEGKMRDLTDVEELLYCWKNLKSPVFINLVCRFYGELCKDLFSHNVEEEDFYSLV